MLTQLDVNKVRGASKPHSHNLRYAWQRARRTSYHRSTLGTCWVKERPQGDLTTSGWDFHCGDLANVISQIIEFPNRSFSPFGGCVYSVAPLMSV